MNKIVILNRNIISLFLLFNEIITNGHESKDEGIILLNRYLDAFLSYDSYHYYDDYFRFIWRCNNAKPNADYLKVIKETLHEFDSTDEFNRNMEIFIEVITNLDDFESLVQILEKNLISELQYKFNIQSVMLANDSIYLNFPLGVKPEFEGIRDYLYADWYGHSDFPYRLQNNLLKRIT